MDDIRFDELFSGDLDNLVELPKRVVRLFISSTFTDMTLERNTLMERVYPRLKKYCRERHGLDFQVVDMRWGVRDEATDDHQTASLCSREIDNCRRMSLGPNFVALVGDKYGFRPLSNKIKSSEYRSLRQALIQLDINTDFLDVWYKEDTNAIPAEYLLQPISSILKNFTNKNEPDLQSIDQRIWSAIQDRLHELLLSGSRELVKQGRMSLEDQLMKYSISVTEREIIEGCLDVKEARSHCLVFIRSIVDLRHHMDDCLAKLSPIWSQQLNASNGGQAIADGRRGSRGRKDSQTRRASLKIGDDVISLNTSCAMNASERRLERQRKLIGRYIDMRSTKDNMWQLDEEAQDALASLRDVKLINKLARTSDAKMQNLTKFRIAWDEHDGVGLKCEEHKQYLNDLSEHFYTNLTRMIRRASKNEEHAFVKSSGLVNEMLQHSHYAKHVSCSFHGRSRELDKVRAYVVGHSDFSSKPMFLYGVGGSGKTSLMAKAATLVKDWILRVKLQQKQSSAATTSTSNSGSQLDRATPSTGNAVNNGIRWNHRPCIIMRFCCTTPASSSMLDVLSSVARQLQYHFYQYGPLSGQSQQHEQHLTKTANNSNKLHQLTDNNGKLANFKATADPASQDKLKPSTGAGSESLVGIDEVASSSFGSQLPYQKLPEDFVQLVFSFRQLLDNCRHVLHEKRLFIIILDSIERLTTPAQSGVEVKYSWLTSIARLPPNVRLIVSCSSEQTHGHDYASFVHLKRHFLQSHFLQMRQQMSKQKVASNTPFGSIFNNNSACNHENAQQTNVERLRLKSLASLTKNSRLPWIIHVKPLGVKLATEVVRHWLREKGRSLSVQQWAIVERCFSHCSRPIFVKLAFDEVLNWRSYSMQSDAKGLTFGSSLVGDNKNQLLASYSLNDPVLASLAAHCGTDFDDFCESDQMKLQILTMEQEWFNYFEHNQRKEQIVQSGGLFDQQQQPGGQKNSSGRGTNGKKRHSKAVEANNQQADSSAGNVLIKIDTMMSSSGGTKSNSHVSSVSSNLCHLSNTIDDAICQLFARIELQHGFILTKHSLSYLTIARNGICENELEDVLSLDDVVLDDVFQYHLPPVRRIPPLLWTRIRNDLPDYLSERDADGIVINWHHGQFRRVTEARYLTDKRQLVYFHSILADYFLGRWADKAKPFRCTRQQIQLAAEQLDSALQQSARDSQAGGTRGSGAADQNSTSIAPNNGGSRGAGASGSIRSGGSRAVPINSGSIKPIPRASISGSMGRLTGQRSGSIRSGSSFAVRNRLRGSEMNDPRLQSMQAKADRRVPHQPLYYLIDISSSTHSGHHQQQQSSNASGKLTNHSNATKTSHEPSDVMSTNPMDQNNGVAGATKRRYNLRKLTELPYHLIRSGRFLDLAQGVLFNYDWLSSALQALGLQSLLADFEDAVRGLEGALNELEPKVSATEDDQQQQQQKSSTPNDYTASRYVMINYGLMRDQLAELADQSLDADSLRQMINQLVKLESTIRLSCSVLHSDPKMLAPQLIGRLISLVQQPSLASASYNGPSISNCHNKWLSQLLEQCDKHGCSECALLPTDQYLQSPDGMQSSSLEGHLFGVTSMSMGADKRHLLAVSNRFIMWDTTTGQISREVNPNLEASIMRQVEMGYNSEFAIAYTSDDVILALDVLTQQVVCYELPESVLAKPHCEEPIAGLSLIDQFGASRFVVWTRSSWFILRIVNNELDQSVTMRQRISLELVYHLNLLSIPGANLQWLRIVSVRCVKQQQKQQKHEPPGLEVERELSFVEVETIERDKLELITLSCPIESNVVEHRDVSSKPRIEIWRGAGGRQSLAALVLDVHLKQLIYADTRGKVYLSRRRACSWSKPKLLTSPGDIVTPDGSSIRANNYHDGDLVPMSIELDSPSPSKRELESLLLLDDNLDREELSQFERRIEDLDEGDVELGGEIGSEPVFKSHQDSGEDSTSADEQAESPSTGVQLIRLYYGSRLVVLQLCNTGLRKCVLTFPKEVQNVSIELGRCQVRSVCLGSPVKFLVASAGKRLLFFSLDQQCLLRSIEAHSARIVQLMTVVNEVDNSDSDESSLASNGTQMSVASASMDKTVKIWTLSNVDKPDELIQRLSDRIDQLSILKNGQIPLAACLTRTGQLGLFNWATLKLVHARLGHGGDPEANLRLELSRAGAANAKIYRAKFSPNGQFLCLATETSINLYTFESFQAKPPGVAGGANSTTCQNINLKLHSKLAIPAPTVVDSYKSSGQHVLKLKFVIQDSRILTILEQTTALPSSMRDGEAANEIIQGGPNGTSSSPESSVSNSTNSTGEGTTRSRNWASSSGARNRLLVLCHSLSDSRLIYTLELNPLSNAGNQPKQTLTPPNGHDENAKIKTNGDKLTIKISSKQSNSFKVKVAKDQKRVAVSREPKQTTRNSNAKANKQNRIGPLPVVTKDRLHIVALECNGPPEIDPDGSDSSAGGRFLKVYSTRDGLLVRAIGLDRLELAGFGPDQQEQSSGLSHSSALAGAGAPSGTSGNQSDLRPNGAPHPTSTGSLGPSKSKHLDGHAPPATRVNLAGTRNHNSLNQPSLNRMSSSSILPPLSLSSSTVAAAHTPFAASTSSSTPTDRSTVNLMNEPVTKLSSLIYRDRATVVALMDEESGASHLVDVSSRQLLISSSLWSGKISSDGRFGLTRFYRATASSISSRNSLAGRLTQQAAESSPSFNSADLQKKSLNHANNSAQQTKQMSQSTPSNLIGNRAAGQGGGVGSGGSGLELLEMRRMGCLHTLLSGRDLSRLGGRPELLVSGGASLSDQEIQCGFTRPNDQYVYYYDPRLTSLLLIRLRDSKLMANYRLSAQVTQIKCSPDGLALILVHSDGSLCSLAIADPEKNDTLVRLAQYPSRRQTPIR